MYPLESKHLPSDDANTLQAYKVARILDALKWSVHDGFLLMLHFKPRAC